MTMKYIGNGRWKAGLPARDLTEDEVALYGAARLKATGLYEATKKKEPASPPGEEN